MKRSFQAAPHNRGIRITAVLLLAAAMAPTYAGALSRLTASLPDLAPPPQGEAQWIARSARINGVPMTLKAFRSSLTPDAVLHHYQSWSLALAGAETERSTREPWRVLAIRSRCCFITIQARAVLSGAEGTIAVSPPLNRAAQRADSSFPRPPSARLVNLQEYEDDGVEAEHLALRSVRSPAIEAAAFRELLEREGWTTTRHPSRANSPRVHVIEVQKGAQHAHLTLLPDASRSGATAIVIVWRKS